MAFHQRSGATWLVAMKKNNKKPTVRPIDAQGRIGAEFQRPIWSTGTTHLVSLRTHGKWYVIQINRNRGDYSVRRWYRTGRIGGALHSGKFTAKWTDFAAFDHSPGARLAMVMETDKRRPAKLLWCHHNNLADSA